MKRYKHNLSNYKLATMDMGSLVPVQCVEVLPGDTMQLETSALIRVSPQLAPVMHPCVVRFHHWFVPNRILWDGWEDFITGGEDGQDAQVIPTLNVNWAPDRLHDYFGIPPADPSDATTRKVNSLPFRAYNKIYNEFYRDQDLQTERLETDVTIAKVNWSKDYFTTARPWEQKGNDITLPIGDTAPVSGSASFNGFSQYSNSSGINGTLSASGTNVISSVADVTDIAPRGSVTLSNLQADLSQATGVTATQFREFFALQRYAEARARYGSRYTEYLRYLGVTPSDARLQRPEYLGGGKQTIQFSEILQTGTDGTNPVGTLRGHGIGALRTKRTRKFFEEHGYVLTLMSVVPKSIYQDGIDRTFVRKYKEDFFQKELQNVGQQPVLQEEVDGTRGANFGNVFGYSSRYAEYTSQRSSISGEFRDSLDFWHMGRKWSTQPALNSDFITCSPTKRVFADQLNHSLWCMINNKVVARRAVKNVNIGRLL